jgi:hypothetical protein
MVGSRFVASLAKPGGNTTGVSPQRRMSALAQSGRPDTLNQCPLLGVKQTWADAG